MPFKIGLQFRVRQKPHAWWSPPVEFSRDERERFGRALLAGGYEAAGKNPTHQRIEIAYALFSRGEHLSADRILAIASERNSETSEATVYNTLNPFIEKKLIREVIVDPGKVFYNPNTEPHHHFHDVDTCDLSDIDAAAATTSGRGCRSAPNSGARVLQPRISSRSGRRPPS